MCSNWSLRVVIDLERWLPSGASSYRISYASPFGDEVEAALGESGRERLAFVLAHELVALIVEQDAMARDCI